MNNNYKREINGGLENVFATAGGGCAALCGGSPAKLPGFEMSFEIFVNALKSTSEK